MYYVCSYFPQNPTPNAPAPIVPPRPCKGKKEVAPVFICALTKKQSGSMRVWLRCTSASALLHHIDTLPQRIKKE